MGVKAEVEKSANRLGRGAQLDEARVADDDDDEGDENIRKDDGRMGDNAWVEVTVEIPGFRDDDSMPVFLAALLNEALVADGEFTRRLWINSRFHWKLYIDVRILETDMMYDLTILLI